MTPRITISLNQDGTLELFVNEAGRDELVARVSELSTEHDHIHLMPSEFSSDCCLSQIPYRATDKVISFAKIILRSDAWDEEHYPHVMETD